MKELEGAPGEAPPPRFGKEWFKSRAAGSLSKLQEGTWDYSDSLLLYAPTGQKAYEDVQQTGNAYHELVTAPEREQLARIAEDIVRQLPDHFIYVDLGPGTEHKEQFFFDACKKLGKKLVYVPVDISRDFLAAADDYATGKDIPSGGIQNSFEDLSPKSVGVGFPVFVSLGLTYSNYEPEKVLPMLRRLAGENGYAFINSQVRERVDMEKVKNIYTNDIYTMCDAKLALLGFNPRRDIAERETNDGVEVWYTLKSVPKALKERGLAKGDKLLMLRSLRPSLEKLTQDLEASGSYELFDRGGSFVGALLKT